MSPRTTTNNDELASPMGSDHSSRRSSHSPFEDDEHDEDESSPPSRPTSGTLRVLARGNACLCCRRRKLKCDGTKPHCGPCTRGRRTNECNYEEAKVKTKTQVLQARIRELESRVKRMAEREKIVNSKRSLSPQHDEQPRATSSTPASVRRHTLPSPLQPTSPSSSSRPPPHHADSTFSLPVPLRTESADSTLSFSYDPSSTFPSSDPLLPGLSSWSSDSNDFAFGHSDLLQSVSSVIAARTSAVSDPWPSTATPATGFGTGSWLDLIPPADPSALFAVDALTGATGATMPPAVVEVPTVAPASLGRTLAPSSYLPPTTGGSNYTASPSLSAAVTTNSSTHSSVSSPPSSNWEDDVRLSALDLTRRLDVDDVPADISRELVAVFFRHRKQCMFEVHADRFIASLTLPPQFGPHPALINAIYLLGCHFSPNSPLSQYESLFLARTRKGINSSLENADRLLNFLQASCLLAWYFFFKGRLLEGHYHASAAARFAMSCGLHLLKVKADGLQGTLTFYCPSPAAPGDRSILPQPEDSIALAERINLFWSIFLADRIGSIGTGLSVVIRDDEIETPWPRRFEDFELNDLVRFDSNTLRSLYTPGNAGAYIKASDNLHAVTCKAMAIHERASRLASLLESDPSAVSDPDFWPQFDSIDAATTRLIESLPPIRTPVDGAVPTGEFIWEDEEVYDQVGHKATVSPSLILAYTAAYGAVIQLHRMFSQNDAGSYKRCLTAARSAMLIVNETQKVNQTYLPMALGIIWTCVAEALAVEYERLKRLAAQPQLKEVERDLTQLFLVMKDLRRVFPILTLRISKVPLFVGCAYEVGYPACENSSLPMPVA